MIPSESFETLEKLKDAIDSDLGIIFPDTSNYIFNQRAMYQKVYKGQTNIVVGYDFAGDIESANMTTNLWRLNFKCRIINATYDKNYPITHLNYNAKVLDTDVEEQILDKTDDPNVSALGWYPEGSKIIHYSYDFDFKGRRYSVSGTLVIPPEQLNTLGVDEVDAIVENGKSEMLYLVKSIINQGENEK